MSRHSRPLIAAAALIVSAVLLVSSGAGATHSAGYPSIPIGDDGKFVVGLTAPALAPGAGGAVTFALVDPWTVTLSSVDVEFGLYAFNAYPGNATGPVPANAPQFDLTSSQLGSGPPQQGHPVENGSLQLGTIDPGESIPVALAIVSDAATPSGDFAIRLALSYAVPNGSAYRLESRGYFSQTQWNVATEGPNGTSTLNLTTLGVSGVIPETAILVRANPFPVILYALLGGAVVLAAAGGYYAFRRGPGSRSGASSPPEPSHAPRALGNRRTSDGD